MSRWCAAHAARHPDLGAAALEVAGGIALFCGVDSPMTKVTGVGGRGPVLDSDLHTIERFYAARGTSFEVALSARADATLAERLADRGYERQGVEIVLVRPNVAPEGPVGSDPSIVRLEPGDTERCARVLARAAVAPSPPSEILLAVARTSFELPGVFAWVVHRGGRDIASAAHSVDAEGIASLFGGATDLDHRGQGIQRALIAARLHAIAETEASWIVVVAGEGTTSYRNAVRCGFEPFDELTQWRGGTER